MRAIKYDGLIAPCGMNCGICIGYLREKKPCGGCFNPDSDSKPKHCSSCVIVNCDILKKTKSKFCSEKCKKYPCARLRRLDKRYRTNYGMSMIENLDYIQNYGLKKFLMNEENRWNCPECGEIISVHRKICSNCGKKKS